MRKDKQTTNKPSTKPKVNKLKAIKTAICDISLLLVVASISFLGYTVWFGTNGMINKVLAAPAILFAAKVLVTKFTK